MGRNRPGDSGNLRQYFSMIAHAAVCGQGAALLPRFLMAQELAGGSLVELLPNALLSTHAYYLVYPEARAQTPLVKAFRGWLVAECAGSPGARPAGVTRMGQG